MRAAKDTWTHLATWASAAKKRTGAELTGYKDADYAGDKSDLRSKSGVIYMLNDSQLSWTSQRQNLIAQTSTESEYVALATGGKKGTGYETACVT